MIIERLAPYSAAPPPMDDVGAAETSPLNSEGFEPTPLAADDISITIIEVIANAATTAKVKRIFRLLTEIMPLRCTYCDLFCIDHL